MDIFYLHEILQQYSIMLLHKYYLKIVHHLNIVEQIIDTFVDYADFINITTLMYNLIEYSDKY